MRIKDTQYVLVRYRNTLNPHCHLIFNRVDNNGKRISDIKTIMPIILETLANAEAIEKDVEKRLAEAQQAEEEIAKQEEIIMINN